MKSQKQVISVLSRCVNGAKRQYGGGIQLAWLSSETQLIAKQLEAGPRRNEKGGLGGGGNQVQGRSGKWEVGSWLTACKTKARPGPECCIITS